ncbi:DUF397 domain-containing protein [Streptomyces sp. NBC_01261]|uniref:DUF397 domain-containing protein n=1 Tax=unclassified Streptomyces TaxID=2593676 RepID=UPI002E2BF9E6|nr:MULTISPECIES: DUF397 domain-containing protein [unclassified Streptomyces]
MRAIDLSNVTWRKSSYSNTDGGNCIEVAHDLPLVPVRDSKNPAHGTLVFSVDAWSEFVSSAKAQ